MLLSAGQLHRPLAQSVAALSLFIVSVFPTGSCTSSLRCAGQAPPLPQSVLGKHSPFKVLGKHTVLGKHSHDTRVVPQI